MVEGLAHDSEQITSILTVIQGSPIRPTCWHSTPPSRRPGPASRARFCGGGRRGAQAGGQHPAGGAEYPGADRQDPPQLHQRGQRHPAEPAADPSGGGEADQAEAALGSIFQAIATINDMTYQIASAAEEQSSVSETVSGNLSKPAHWPTTSPGTPPARPTPVRPCVRRRNVCNNCWVSFVSADNFHAPDSPSGASPFYHRRHICLMAGNVVRGKCRAHPGPSPTWP